MFDVDYKVVEEIKIGSKRKPGIWMRLEESPKGKRVIRLWSTLSKDWHVMYRYDVEKNWNGWKNYADVHPKGHKIK